MNEDERKIRDMVMKTSSLRVLGHGCIRVDINDPIVQKNIRETQKKFGLMFFESKGLKGSGKIVD